MALHRAGYLATKDKGEISEGVDPLSGVKEYGSEHDYKRMTYRRAQALWRWLT